MHIMGCIISNLVSYSIGCLLFVTQWVLWCQAHLFSHTVNPEIVILLFWWILDKTWFHINSRTGGDFYHPRTGHRNCTKNFQNLLMWRFIGKLWGVFEKPGHWTMDSGQWTVDSGRLHHWPLPPDGARVNNHICHYPLVTRSCAYPHKSAWRRKKYIFLKVCFMVREYWKYWNHILEVLLHAVKL
jgi:hypothetical protein